MKELCLLLLFCGLVTAQPNGSLETTTEEILVRCPRLQCIRYCELGNQLDSKGCPMCQCLTDPCEEATCSKNQICLKKDSCDSNPCTELPYTCEDFPCPQVMCANFCEYGLEKNEYGCDTCICRKNPCDTKECKAEEECKVIDDESCPPGAYCNKAAKCVPKAPIGLQEEPMLPACGLRQCRMLCRFGFRKDEQGCDKCTCKESPCEDIPCGKAEKCVHNVDEECAHDICDVKPKCTVKPICEHMRDEHMNNMPMDMDMGSMPHMGSMGHRIARAAQDAMQHPLDCDEMGRFQPRQCHPMTGDCWCVNDLGQEIDGTRRTADDPEGKPACPYNKTQAIHGHLQLSHDIGENLADHTEKLKPLLIQNLGEWMMIKEEYFQEITISPSGDAEVQVMQVDFIVRGTYEDDVDLASSVNHLRLTVESEETVIQYEDFTLTPVPQSIQVEHQFQAEPMVYPGIEKDDDLVSFCYNHKTTIVAACVGLLLLALIIIVLAVKITKRRKLMRMSRMDNYKQNLAFTNEVYGRLAFLDEIAKDKAPDSKDSNEATA